jgi:hypothetical protein
MAFKCDFFTPPIDSDYQLDWESILIELSLGIICSVMAVYGRNTGMVIMAYPSGLVALMCFGLVAYSLITFITEKVRPK